MNVQSEYQKAEDAAGAYLNLLLDGDNSSFFFLIQVQNLQVKFLLILNQVNS
jgi:hypothetical protein